MPSQSPDKDICFAPLSQVVSPFLPMRGPSVAGPGDRLSIDSRFKGWGGYWLSVSHPRTGCAQEVAIKWISRRHDGTFLALAPIFMLYDPADVNEPAYCLARIDDWSCIRLLTPRELESQLPLIQAEIVGRRIWPADRQVAVLETDILETLGPFE